MSRVKKKSLSEEWMGAERLSLSTKESEYDEKSMLKWFDNIQRVKEDRITKEICDMEE